MGLAVTKYCANLLLVALAELLGWNASERVFDVLAATGPGDFAAVVAGGWTTHGFSLSC